MRYLKTIGTKEEIIVSNVELCLRDCVKTWTKKYIQYGNTGGMTLELELIEILESA